MLGGAGWARGRRAAAVALALAGLAAAAVATSSRAGRPLGTGVVAVNTNLAYQDAAAAGTGMVLPGTRNVLTNNHVIRGATTIRIADPASGRSTTARVLGYDVAADVALLAPARRTGLQTVAISKTGVKVDQPVTAVGNAGGTGYLSTAYGKVVAVNRAITAGDDDGNSERLTGLIETDAALRPGDSGGPLLDAAGRVVGMNAAASPAFSFHSGSGDGFAIPIERALAIARAIVAGRGSSTIHIGGTAFLGVQVARAGAISGGADVAGGQVISVVPGSPAERAGLVPDDVIVSVAGRAVSSPAALITFLLGKHPGDTVGLSWVQTDGDRRQVSLKLASGPPQ